jgi:hypothetical protein
MGVSLMTHFQQRKEKAKIDQDIEALNIKIRNLDEPDLEFEKLKKTGMVALEKLTKSKDNWWYLGELEGIKKKYKPYFRNISASRIKDGSDFKIYSRLIKMSSSFSESVDLIDSLEGFGGFKIESLDVQANEEDSRKHDVEFWLAFSRVKQPIVDKLAAALVEKKAKKVEKNYYTTSLRLPPSWKKNRLLVVNRGGRDPFINLKKSREEWLAKLEEERNKAGFVGGGGNTADLSDKLILKGILSVKGTKMAILDAQYDVIPGKKNLYRYNVKVGDFVGEKEVVRIEDNRVFLKAENKMYLTMMR